MSVLHLQFTPHSKPLAAYFGGLPHLADAAQWPTCPATREPQLHLLTLGPDFFFTPTIGEGYALSVFVSFDFAPDSPHLTIPRELAIHLPEQAANAGKGYSRVLLHQPGAAGVFGGSSPAFPLRVSSGKIVVADIYALMDWEPQYYQELPLGEEGQA